MTDQATAVQVVAIAKKEGLSKPPSPDLLSEEDVSALDTVLNDLAEKVAPYLPLQSGLRSNFKVYKRLLDCRSRGKTNLGNIVLAKSGEKYPRSTHGLDIDNALKEIHLRRGHPHLNPLPSDDAQSSKTKLKRKRGSTGKGKAKAAVDEAVHDDDENDDDGENIKRQVKRKRPSTGQAKGKGKARATVDDGDDVEDDVEATTDTRDATSSNADAAYFNGISPIPRTNNRINVGSLVNSLVQASGGVVSVSLNDTLRCVSSQMTGPNDLAIDDRAARRAIVMEILGMASGNEKESLVEAILRDAN
jgi:hypothetical protein